jgi:hypothetical protein
VTANHAEGLTEALLYTKYKGLVASMNQNVRNDENISEFTQYIIKNLTKFNFDHFS